MDLNKQKILKIYTINLLLLCITSCTKKVYSLEEYNDGLNEIILLSKNSKIHEAIRKTKALLNANYPEIREQGFESELNYELAKLYKKIGDNDLYNKYLNKSIGLHFYSAYIEKCNTLLSQQKYDELFLTLDTAVIELSKDNEWVLNKVTITEFYIRYYLDIGDNKNAISVLNTFFEELEELLKYEEYEEFATLTIWVYFNSLFMNNESIKMFNEYSEYHSLREKLLSNEILNKIVNQS